MVIFLVLDFFESCPQFLLKFVASKEASKMGKFCWTEMKQQKNKKVMSGQFFAARTELKDGR